MSKLQTLVYKKYNIDVRTLVEYVPNELPTELESTSESLTLILGTASSELPTELESTSESLTLILGTTSELPTELGV